MTKGEWLLDDYNAPIVLKLGRLHKKVYCNEVVNHE